MSSDANERDLQLRRVLVGAATADAATSTRSSRRRLTIASLTAFTVAGVLTGGAVSAAALGIPASPPPPSTVYIEAAAQNVVSDDTRLFGTPFVVSGYGETSVVVDRPDDGGTGMMIAFNCVDPGTFDVVIDGSEVFSTTCGEESGGRGGGARFYPLETGTSGDYRLEVRAGASQRFAMWASWAEPAAYPSSAEQEDALADGVVTEQEYRDGFSRYEQCMSDAGFPLVGVDSSSAVITYVNSHEAVQSGAEGRCYASEFQELDVAWQSAQSG